MGAEQRYITTGTLGLEMQSTHIIVFINLTAYFHSKLYIHQSVSTLHLHTPLPFPPFSDRSQMNTKAATKFEIDFNKAKASFDMSVCAVFLST